MHLNRTQFLKVVAMLHFQFPLLGIFPCIVRYTFWCRFWWLCFQFPLLGIFPCIIKKFITQPAKSIGELSIPFTWDFSMHLLQFLQDAGNSNQLSIPFTWDFSMHQLTFELAVSSNVYDFQFPLLGIFPCIQLIKKFITQPAANFQFPLLGIFPCIKPHAVPQSCSRI